MLQDKPEDDVNCFLFLSLLLILNFICPQSVLILTSDKFIFLMRGFWDHEEQSVFKWKCENIKLKFDRFTFYKIIFHNSNKVAPCFIKLNKHTIFEAFIDRLYVSKHRSYSSRYKGSQVNYDEKWAFMLPISQKFRVNGTLPCTVCIWKLKQILRKPFDCTPFNNKHVVLCCCWMIYMRTFNF